VDHLGGGIQHCPACADAAGIRSGNVLRMMRQAQGYAAKNSAK